MTTIPAEALEAGTAFYAKGSSRLYTVVEVIEAHRSEYAAVVRVLSSKGTESTVSFPLGTTVILHSSSK